jgi:hypothetical protein
LISRAILAVSGATTAQPMQLFQQGSPLASSPSRALNSYDPAANVDVDNAQRNTAAAGGGRWIRS